MAYDEDLGYRLREILYPADGLSEKAMFGGLAFLINGNMAVAASSQGGLLLRINPEDAGKLLAKAHTEPFVMRDREMTGWLRVDAGGIRTKRDLQRWAQIGIAYASSLPPKSGKRHSR